MAKAAKKRTEAKSSVAKLATSRRLGDAGIGVSTKTRREGRGGVAVGIGSRLAPSQSLSRAGMARGVETESLGAELSIGTANNAAALAFLKKLHEHFASRSDSLSPSFLDGLCNSFNDGTLDERGLYVGILRLLVNTNATHLFEGLKRVLPASWKTTDLSWLEEAVKEDCAWQAKVAGMAVASGRVMSAPPVAKMAQLHEAIDLTDEMDVDDSDEIEEVVVERVVKNKKKKKRPIAGYRAERVSHIVGILEETVEEAVEQTGGRKAGTAMKATPPKKKAARNGKTKAPVPIDTKASPSAASPTPSSHDSPLPTRQDSPFNPPATSTPLPTATNHSLPFTTSPHIFPTRRAILSRPSKPYTHLLCSARFNHPEDVRKHHSGTLRSGSCWAKHGSPVGREWDEDPNCKVRIGTGGGKVEVEVLRGEREGEVGFRGFRVKSWGDWGALLDLGGAEGKGDAEGEESFAADGEVKMEIQEDAAEVAECDAPAAKKRKVSKDGVVAKCAERIAGLGLRARK